MGFTLHHFGVAVADIREAASRYIELFGYRLESELIHDQRQEAYVQFLRFPGDSTFLELVQPDGPESKLSRAIAKGGGLNHICLSTDDIEAACRDLRRRGLFLIAPPTPAVAFKGRRIAWLMGRDRVITELVECGEGNEL